MGLRHHPNEHGNTKGRCPCPLRKLGQIVSHLDRRLLNELEVWETQSFPPSAQNPELLVAGPASVRKDTQISIPEHGMIIPFLLVFRERSVRGRSS